MSYTVFARKYRPQTFDEIVGQDHIVRTLKNGITQNRLAQAYLFVGPRGTGKTTTARILAKALNCTGGPKVDFDPNEDVCREIAEGRSMDVLEFDAASNTQVDKIREIIIDNVKYAPTRGKYKVYIVDEVHMLSTSSFNALLKTLEEPPAHVKFVFATTDVQKVPSTIISRCQRFDLRRIGTAEIAAHLLFIAGKENLALSPAAAETIARGAEGGLRDAESMLDQLVAFCGEKIDEADVLKVFGLTSAQTVSGLCAHLIAGECAPALGVIHEECEAGKDLSRLMGDLIAHLRNLLVIQCDPAGVKDELSAETIAALTAQSERLDREKLLELIEQFAAAEGRMKWAPNKKMHFEIAVIRAAQTLRQATLTEVLETLTALRSGGIDAEAQPPIAPPIPKRSLSDALTAEFSRNAPAPAAPAQFAEPAAEPAPTARTREEPASSERAPEVAPPSISVVDLWPQLLTRVRKERPLVTSWVEEGVLSEIVDSTALFAFPPEADLAREACERPNNRKFLEALLTELAGRPLTLRCERREGLVVERPSVPETQPEPPHDPHAAFRNDPLIKKALADFKAEIIPA